MEFVWPDEEKAAFVIRDDDISYFTSMEKLEKLYKEAWKMGFKVSFAVVPMQKALDNIIIPPTFRGAAKYCPVYQNEELVKYLRVRILEGKVDVVQHGYCHMEIQLPSPMFDFEKGETIPLNGQELDSARYSEFYGLTEHASLKRIREGRKILEHTFNSRVKVFVAPQEYLPKSLWKALRREGRYYCGFSNIRAVPISDIRVSSFIPNVLRRILKRKVYPQGVCDVSSLPHLVPTFRHSWNRNLDDKTANFWFRRFKEEFQACLGRKGIFILLTHHWEYFYDWQKEITQKKQFEYFCRMMDYVDKYDVWKCGLTELFEWLFERDGPHEFRDTKVWNQEGA
jgi:hypothetical protein